MTHLPYICLQNMQIMEMLKTPLGRLRVVGFLEGCSYLALAITMPIKYVWDTPGPNYVVGMLHGLLFILYIGLVLQNAYLRKWPIITTGWALLASLIPFGTFVADWKIFKPAAIRDQAG